MARAQKIIKYLAISFAFLLIVSIFQMIVSLFFDIFDIDKLSNNLELKSTIITNDIKILDIDLNNTKLTITNDDIFKVEASKSIKVNIDNDKLKIKENNDFLHKQANNEVIIYIPNSYTFDEINLENGVGKINIENLNTNTLDLDLGVGNVNILKLNVLNNIKIESGTGSLNINECIINNLELDMGVGKVTINGIINGESFIDAGIGNLVLNLNNSINNYNLELKKGIGKIKVNNTVVDNNYTSNLGNNLIKIDGGIGNISINTLN